MIMIWFSLKPLEKKKVEEPYTLIAWFGEVKGLELGESVALMGKEIGKVEAIEFNASRKMVGVTLAIAGEYKLPVDSRAAIYFKSLLGRFYVHVKYGESDQYLKDGDELITYEVPDLNTVVEDFAKITTDAKDLISSLNENQQKVTEKITSLVDDNKDNIKKAIDAFGEMGPKIEKVANEITNMVKDVKEGNSTIGRLLNDDELYNDIDDIIKSVQSITVDVKSGKGTLSKLLYDDKLHREVSDTLDGITQVAAEAKAILADEEGKMGEMMDSLKETLPRLEETASNFAEISKGLKEGKGTLGKLINDPSLYDDAVRTVNQIEEAFKQGEEQGLMQTFIGVAFATLM
jgi:phospholipid/cholesterol/gamma-HCH transport system substrate-binding protein